MIEYEQRNAILRKLGYESYEAYLQSPKWRKLRARVLKQAKGKCRVCGDKATDVHHSSYSEHVLAGKTITPLVALCRTCHEIGEFTTKGRKCSLAECNSRLKLNRRKIQPPKRKKAHCKPPLPPEAKCQYCKRNQAAGYAKIKKAKARKAFLGVCGRCKKAIAAMTKK